MKLTIDTKEDSHEDIRKVIKMLQHLVGDSPVTNQPDIFDDPNSFGIGSSEPETSASSGNVFGNMFDTPQTNQEESFESKESSEDEEDTPEIMPY